MDDHDPLTIVKQEADEVIFEDVYVGLDTSEESALMNVASLNIQHKFEDVRLPRDRHLPVKQVVPDLLQQVQAGIPMRFPSGSATAMQPVQHLFEDITQVDASEFMNNRPILEPTQDGAIYRRPSMKITPRHRAPSVTQQDKDLLLDILRGFVSIVENKRTDGTTVRKKHDTWNLVTTIYNSQSCITTKRSTEQLRKLWENMKTKHKKDTSLLTSTDDPDQTATSLLESTPTRQSFDSVGHSLLAASAASKPTSQPPSFRRNFLDMEYFEDETEYEGVEAPIISPLRPNSTCVGDISSDSSTSSPPAPTRDEHQERLSQLHKASLQRDELHALHLQEAKSTAEIARLRALNAAEELEFERERRKRVLQALDAKLLRDRSPLP